MAENDILKEIVSRSGYKSVEEFKEADKQAKLKRERELAEYYEPFDKEVESIKLAKEAKLKEYENNRNKSGIELKFLSNEELIAEEKRLKEEKAKEMEKAKETVNQSDDIYNKRLAELEELYKGKVSKLKLIEEDLAKKVARNVALENRLLDQENFLVKKSESLTNKINLYRSELNNFNLAVESFNKEKELFNSEKQTVLAEVKVMKEEVAKVVVSDSFTKVFKKVDKEFEAARISRYQSEAESEEKLKLRIGYDKRSYNGFINKEDLIVLLKGDDKKEFKIKDALLVNNSKGFINSESGYEYPLMMRVSGNNKEYEAFSLTLKMFDEYLGDSFNRYGVYFINGLGLFTLTLKKTCLELIYQKGNNHKDVENYVYSVPNVADKKVSVRKIAEIVENNIEELLTEGAL